MLLNSTQNISCRIIPGGTLLTPHPSKTDNTKRTGGYGDGCDTSGSSFSVFSGKFEEHERRGRFTGHIWVERYVFSFHSTLRLNTK